MNIIKELPQTNGYMVSTEQKNRLMNSIKNIKMNTDYTIQYTNKGSTNKITDTVITIDIDNFRIILKYNIIDIAVINNIKSIWKI